MCHFCFRRAGAAISARVCVGAAGLTPAGPIHLEEGVPGGRAMQPLVPTTQRDVGATTDRQGGMAGVDVGRRPAPDPQRDA